MSITDIFSPFIPFLSSPLNEFLVFRVLPCLILISLFQILREVISNAI